jgi:hypothetical protein
MIGKWLVAWVATQPALVALVGSRVEPFGSFAGEPRPRMTYTLVSRRRVRHLRGASRVDRSRVQVDCLGSTYAEAVDVAALVDAADGYSGRLGDVQVLDVQVADRRADGDQEAASEKAWHRVSLDLLVWTQQ